MFPLKIVIFHSFLYVYQKLIDHQTGFAQHLPAEDGVFAHWTICKKVGPSKIGIPATNIRDKGHGSGELLSHNEDLKKRCADTRNH